MKKFDFKALQAQFPIETKAIIVPSWNGVQVIIQKLTIAQSNKIQEAIIGEIEVDNEKDNDKKEEKKTMTVDMEDVNASAILKASLCLVDDSLTVESINSLGADALAGVVEINAELDAWDKPKKSQEEKPTTE